MEYALFLVIAVVLVGLWLLMRRRQKRRARRINIFDDPYDVPIQPGDFFMCIRQGDGSYKPGFYQPDKEKNDAAPK